ADGPVRVELGAAPQRSPGHRTSRCPLLLWDRTLAPAARAAAGLALAGGLVLRGAGRSPRRPQRAVARSQRLLSVLRSHGAAPAAHPGVPAAAAARDPGLAAGAAAPASGGTPRRTGADPAGGGRRHLQRDHRHVAPGAILRP